MFRKQLWLIAPEKPGRPKTKSSAGWKDFVKADCLLQPGRTDRGQAGPVSFEPFDGSNSVIETITPTFFLAPLFFTLSTRPKASRAEPKRTSRPYWPPREWRENAKSAQPDLTSTPAPLSRAPPRGWEASKKASRRRFRLGVAAKLFLPNAIVGASAAP
ncbi:ATP-dependent DNA helicase [Anopheles sinensis]|uniref:ATP-dependent DNA helicase n=1 Tax=Anopheles sinensis TaxID=74873 RepID=A0A084WP88_ANOSI|nr:ATP-dependent DNA helicase [Anopheles sinensis]